MMYKWFNKLLCMGLATVMLVSPSLSHAATELESQPIYDSSKGMYVWPDAPPPPSSASELLHIAPSTVEPASAELDVLDTGWSKETKLKVLNIGIIGGMMLYGLIFWDYGENGFEFINEGWFGYDTKYGGADKLGHAFSTYFAVQAFSSVYERWGYDRHRGNVYGALSAWATFFMIEVADATSRHGFSYEDLIVDTVGAIVGYWRREFPEFEKRVDFRVEYWPSYAVTKGEDTDLVSDYSGYKYLVALKGSGFDFTSSTWLQYLELQGGYYTRGFQNGDQDFYGDPHRVLYGALAINLTHIFHKNNWNKTASFLRYYQVPYTYVPLEYNIDE